MAWDWIEKGSKRLQELGGEYKQHQVLVERLLGLDPAEARSELARAWLEMDGRARAGLKMTLAARALSQQAAPSTAESQVRLERIKAIRAQIEDVSRDAAAAPEPASREAAFTAGAARVTNKLADAAERARPRASELVDSARKGIEKHGPAVEAAVKSVISELLKPPAPPREPVVPSPMPEDPPQRATAAAGTTTISGVWAGTLRRAGSEDQLGCDLHVSPSGRPLWAFHDTRGFQTRELTHAGQRLQYVPPGGGVATVDVQSVTGSTSETGYVVDYSFEGSSNGYLTQKYQRLVLVGRLRGAQLDVTYSEAGLSSFGDKTGLAATEGATEYRGSLAKETSPSSSAD